MLHVCCTNLSLSGRAEGWPKQLLLLLVQLGEAVGPEWRACQRLAKDGIHW